MAPRNRIIIDTDPGIDDVLAMLLAFASNPEDVEIMLLSLTHGNVAVQDCLRNVISLFHILEKERSWREEHAKSKGFATLDTFKPIVAVGANDPLEDQLRMMDFFHGKDGLGDIHSSHPHLSPSETWRSLFNLQPEPGAPSETVPKPQIQQSIEQQTFFTPSLQPAHKEILQLLKTNPSDTITIVAIGPLTNLAIAASEDPETFLKVKEVVVMGGTIDSPGNVTPFAEFNIHADAVAASRIFSLTSPNPLTTMPPAPPPPRTQSTSTSQHLPPYPSPLPRRLNLTILPLDITTRHTLLPDSYRNLTDPLSSTGSPLAEWTSAFLDLVFSKSLARGENGLSLHDPLAVFYAIATSSEGWEVRRNIDARVECAGQWTRGAVVVDKRGGERGEEGPGEDLEKPRPMDRGGWRSEKRGNRVNIVTKSCVEGEGVFGDLMISRIFGVADEG